MVNDYTNINKTITSPQIIEHKNTTAYDVGYPGPGLGQSQKCDGIELIKRTATPSFS